jgi:hypothetical protein
MINTLLLLDSDWEYLARKVLKHNAVDIDDADMEPEVPKQVSTEVATLPVCQDEYIDMERTEPKVRKQVSAKDLSPSSKQGRSRRELVLADLNKIEPSEGRNEGGMVGTVIRVFSPVQDSQRKHTSESYSETPCPPRSAATALDDDKIGTGNSNNEWTREESRLPRSPRLWEAAIGRGRDFFEDDLSSESNRRWSGRRQFGK